jgi:hypothetical protein
VIGVIGTAMMITRTLALTVSTDPDQSVQHMLVITSIVIND